MEFSTKEGIVRLKPSQISFFEYLGREVVIHTETGEWHLRVRLSDVAERMKTFDFVMPHKSFLLAGGLLYLNDQELVITCYQLVARLSEFLAIRLFVLIIRKCRSGMITGKQLSISLVLPVFSVFNVVTLVIFMQVYTTLEMYVLFLVNVVMLLVLNIWFAVLLDTLGENNRLENELSLAGQQARLQMEYYQREEEKYEESRKLIHDIRNHVQTMEQLYWEQNMKEGLSYAQNLHGMLNHLGQTYYTSDKLLNIILNDKAALMEQKKIRADIRIGEIDLGFMQNTDITTIFGNILDNAIEAAEESNQYFIETDDIKRKDMEKKRKNALYGCVLKQ